MLSKEQEAFLEYWAHQRLHKKQFVSKLSIGLPLGVLIAAAILINFLSGWDKRAQMDLSMHTSTIIVVLIAIIGIVLFITIFSAHYRWDQNEVHYQELLAKKEKSIDQSENHE
jgi:ATP/ADP translocase